MPMPSGMAADVLNYLNGIAPLDIVGPMRIRVFLGGGSDAFPNHPSGLVVSLTTATLGSRFATNTNAIVFTAIPSQQVIENWTIFDSSTTPKAVWSGVFERFRTVPVGDSFEIPIGELRVELE